MLDLGGRVRPTITSDDPDAVEHIVSGHVTGGHITGGRRIGG